MRTYWAGNDQQPNSPTGWTVLLGRFANPCVCYALVVAPGGRASVTRACAGGILNRFLMMSQSSNPKFWSRSIFGVAIFTSAFLLFQVQLLLGKFLLPWFGGT